MYFLHVSIIWIVLYLSYYFGMQRLTFFQNNRLFLVSSLILGLLLPLLAPLIIIDKPEVFTISMADMSTIEVFSLQVKEKTVDWHMIALMSMKLIYLLGVAFMLMRLVRGLQKIYQLYQSAEKVKQGNLVFAYNEKPHLPFSFLNVIFLSKGLNFGEKLNKVITHEITHVQQWHSIDVLITEFLQVFFWFNPVLIFYKKSLKDAHEYIADRTVVSQSDYKEYVHLLLHATSSPLEDHLVNSFFNSQIKDRIAMLNLNKSNKKAALRYAIILPMIGVFTYLLASSKMMGNIESNEFLTNLKDTIPSIKVLSVTNLPSKQNTEGEKGLYIWKDSKLNYNGYNFTITNKEINGFFDLTEWKMDMSVNEERKEIKINLLSRNEGASNSTNVVFPPLPPPPPPPAPLYKTVEEMPRFPGCEDKTSDESKIKCANEKLMGFLGANVRYPKADREAKIQGTAVVKFVVLSSGDLSSIEVLRNPGGSLGDAAKEVVESMNSKNIKWIPGRQKGQAVNVEYTIPIKFKLSNIESNNSAPDMKKQIVVVGHEAGTPPPPPPPPPPAIGKELFKIVEDMPRFPGCENEQGDDGVKKKCADEKLLAFLGTNVIYPKEAKEKGIEGMAVVQFNIMKDGSIEDVVVLRDPGAGMGEAARQAVLKMNSMEQKWTPGRQRGQAVNVQYTVPMKFKLNDDSPKENITSLKKDPSKKPLIVLDGKALIQNGSDILAKVDPKDIKSINVFKDEKEILKYTDNPGEFEGLIVVVTKRGAKQNQEASKKALVKGKKIDTDSSLENAEYFLNGVTSNKQKIDAVNPSDILSVEVLKETQNGKSIGKIMIQTKNPESSPSGLSIKAYPNPSPQDRINIAITSKNSKSPAVLKVYDVSGKMIYSEAATISNGSANLEINLSGKVVNTAQVIFIIEQGKEIQMTKVALN